MLVFRKEVRLRAGRLFKFQWYSFLVPRLANWTKYVILWSVLILRMMVALVRNSVLIFQKYL